MTPAEVLADAARAACAVWFGQGCEKETVIRMDALRAALAAFDAAQSTPPQGEVERAREKCVLVCRRAAEEYERNGGCLYNDRHQTICANAVSMGRALLAAEAAAKEGGRRG